MKAPSRFAVVLLAALLCGAAAAHEFHAGSITIDHPWARPSIGEGGNTAAYMKLANGDAAPDRLMAAKSDVAESVSLHETRSEGDVTKMVPVEGGIEVPAGGAVALKPLGLHVMLTRLKRPLKEGGSFPMTLVFETQGEVVVEVNVEASPAPADHHHHQ